MAVKILTGDALDKLAELPDDSVHCVVTSPPYWGLRDYGIAGELGQERTVAEHLYTLLRVFREVWRVLKSDGVFWLNYGDCYVVRSRGGPKVNPGDIQATNKGSHQKLIYPVFDLPLKNLLLLGTQLALALQQPWLRCEHCKQTDHAQRWGRFPNGRKICPFCEKSMGVTVALPGWILRSECIWHKTNGMPESAKDRPTVAHEKVFLFAKQRVYYYDHRAVCSPMKRSTIERATRARKTERVVPGQKPHLGEAVALRPNRRDRQRGHERKHQGFNDRWDAMSKEEQQANGANLRNVWTIATEGYPGNHYATMPTALVELCIKAGTSEKGCCALCGTPWSRKMTKASGGAIGKSWHAHDEDLRKGNGMRVPGHGHGYRPAQTIGWTPTCHCKSGDPVPCTVLDPFGGPGTVGLVANRLGRDAILIELNPAYVEMARTRIQQDNPLFAEVR